MSSIFHRELIKLSETRKPNVINILKSELSMPNTSLAIHIPCPNLDFPRWNFDIAYDYLTALFVGETLAQNCNDIEAHFEGLNTVFFVFNTKNILDIEKFIENLIWLGKGFNDESREINDGLEDEYDDSDDSDYTEFYEEMVDFEAKIESHHLHFPELGDKYMANFIPGMEQVSGDVDLEAIYLNHPERRYGFWKSCASGYLGYDFYVSSWAWIIPHDLNNENIYRNLSIPIKKFGGFLDGIPNLQDAQRITINNLPPIIFNENVALRNLV